MKAKDCEACVRSALALLPAEVQAVIGRVSVVVLEVAPKGWGEFERASFEGHPAVSEAEAEDEGAEPAWPVGTITIIACRMRGSVDVHETVLHELAHALGWDESDVAMMGLSDRGIEDAAASSTVDLE